MEEYKEQTTHFQLTVNIGVEHREAVEAYIKEHGKEGIVELIVGGVGNGH